MTRRPRLIIPATRGFECVICGWTCKHRSDGDGHQCSPAALARYRARESRRLRELDPESPALPAELDERRRTLDDRLAEGFAMMRGVQTT